MSIKYKLLFPLLLGFFGFISIIHWYWAPNFIEFEQSRFIKQAEKELKLIEGDLARHIVSNDLSALFISLDYIQKVHNNKWESLKLINSKGKRIYPLFKPLLDSSKENQLYRHELELTIKNHTQEIGTLFIKLNTSKEYQETKASIQQLELIAFLLSLSLIVFTFYFQHIFIKKPLQRLIQATNQLSQGNFSTKLPHLSKDEIGQLSHHFDIMRQNILTDQKLLQESFDEAIFLAKEAKTANNIKGEFLANMSHEIRTPINGILGINQLLLETETTTKQSRYLQIIKESGTSLLTIINDILDFSKVEAGKLEIEVVPFNLEKLVYNMAQPFILKAEDKEIEFKYPTQLNNLFFKGDPGRIRQILNNLINNAFKFTKTGNISLNCQTIQEHDTIHHLKFIIKDTGIGIPLNQQSKLFEKFNQADNSTTRKFGGTGLGLSISKQLVELMGGEIQLESEPGKGSSFSFTLPLEAVPKMEDTALFTSSDNQQVKFDAKVLLVEDNLTNQIIAQAIIGQMGPQITIANNGAEAISFLKNTDYDLVFMDCQMPILDGYKATQQIRKSSNSSINNQVNIVAMTANAMTGDKEKCLIVGMNDYITKPITVESIYGILFKYIPINKQTKLYNSAINTITDNHTAQIHPIPSTEELFDFNGLKNRLENDLPLIQEIIYTFETQLRKELLELDLMIKNENFNKIYELSHKITGSAGNIGMIKLSRIANELHEFSKKGDLQKFHEQAKKLCETFEASILEAKKKCPKAI
ncbi:ATP-binding protein [Fibrobacterales bacterium]|nr:ATP-binding protein [Fibrobacterales bacterium]